MSGSGPFAPVEELRGVGPKTGAALREAGLGRVVDLLLLLPARYRRRVRVPSPAEAPTDGTLCMVEAAVDSVTRHWFRGRRGSRVMASLDGGTARAVWFNQPWMADRIEAGARVRLEGPVREGPHGMAELVNPRLLPSDDPWPEEGFSPVYPGVAGFSPARVTNLVASALGRLDTLPEPLEPAVLAEAGLPALREALESLHRPDPGLAPEDAEALAAGRTPWHRRIVFDELMVLSAAARRRRERRRQRRGPACLAGAGELEALVACLPFQLTGAQRRVLGEIQAGLRGPGLMARLLQGDVGSGKTVVAGLAAAMMVRSGHQVALMAPTDVLARQHAASLARLLGPAGIEPVLLTGSLAPADRAAVLRTVGSGAASLVVGTHALFQEGVRFASLGLVIVDEQHRFGVLQRRALWEKGRSPHLLVMTATPIPRSLAQTVYGDLDLSILDEMPPGRVPVRTFVREEAARERVQEFLEKELAAGGRVFVIYPRIEDTPGEGGRALESSLPGMQERFGRFGVVVAHGRMEPSRRDAALAAFREGRARMLLATTVVEVGVDIPEANVMVVESAERFGLSQLHQLRGRVGRGSSRAPLCILIAGEGVSEEARSRLEVLEATTDGFEVAEKDLELRGPGELEGIRQWGATGSRLLNLVRHADLVPLAATIADRLAKQGRLESVLGTLERLYRGRQSPGGGATG